MTGTQHDGKRDKPRHSAAGSLMKNHGDAAKGGAGGKGTWGKAGDEKDASSEVTDRRDPNYDSDEERARTAKHVYRLVTAEELEKARAEGHYDGSALDAETGYMHLSSAAQVGKTAARFFAGQDGVHVLEYTVRRLEQMGGTIRWEMNDGERFPHLYDSNLRLDVAKIHPLPREGDVFKDLELPL